MAQHTSAGTMPESEEQRIHRIVTEELTRRGFSGNPGEDAVLLRDIRDHIEAYRETGRFTWRGLVLGILSAALIALWEGVKALAAKVGY